MSSPPSSVLLWKEALLAHSSLSRGQGVEMTRGLVDVEPLTPVKGKMAALLTTEVHGISNRFNKFHSSFLYTYYSWRW